MIELISFLAGALTVFGVIAIVICISATMLGGKMDRSSKEQ